MNTTGTNVVTFDKLLYKSANEITRALPKHLRADQMMRAALTAYRFNKMLARCDPMQVLACVIQASQLGFQIGVLGQGYLVPYFDKRQNTYVCNFIPGWKGLIDLVNRAREATVFSGVIHEGQHYELIIGSSPSLTVSPDFDDTKPITRAYAVGRTKGGDWPIIECWSTEKITRHRDDIIKKLPEDMRKRHYSFAHWEMYARKVMVLQVIKYLPTSVELGQTLSTAIELDNAAELTGNQGITIEGALANEWTPPVEPGSWKDELGLEEPASSNLIGLKEVYKESIENMKDRLAAGDVSGAVSIWDTIPAYDQVVLHAAPTKGGPFTIEENKAIREYNSKAAKGAFSDFDPVKPTGKVNINAV